MSWVWQQMNPAALQEELSMIGEMKVISQVTWWRRKSKARKVIPFFDKCLTEHHLCAKHLT